MNVRRTRQDRRIDLHNRTDQHELPRTAEFRGRPNQLMIESLVEHAEKANAWPGNHTLVRRFYEVAPAGAREVRHVDAARERMDIRVQMFFGFVEAAAAGQHDAGAGQQGAFRVQETGGGAGKSGQLVHAVIHDGRGGQMIGEPQRHRCVVT